MFDEKNLKIQEKVISGIRSGKLRIKPKWHFVLFSFSLVVGFVGLSLVLVFLASLLSFSLRTHGPMGEIRFQQLLSNFPWWAPLLMLLGLFLAYRLFKKYDFSYKKHYLIIIFSFIVAVFLAGWLLEQVGIANWFMRSGRMRGFYQQYDGRGLMRGQGQGLRMQRIQFP